MRYDDRDWDEIIEDEDNPFDNPDTTFESEDSAFEAGKQLALESNGNAIDLDREIDYPSFADEEVIEAFKAGYKEGGRIWFELEYGTDDDNEDIGVDIAEDDEPEDLEDDE